MNKMFAFSFNSLCLRMFSGIVLWDFNLRRCRRNLKMILMFAANETTRQINQTITCAALEIRCIRAFCKPLPLPLCFTTQQSTVKVRHLFYDKEYNLNRHSAKIFKSNIIFQTRKSDVSVHLYSPEVR